MATNQNCAFGLSRPDGQAAEGPARERQGACGCANMPFKPKPKPKPKPKLALSGKKQTKTGKHPGIKAQVTQKG